MADCKVIYNNAGNLEKRNEMLENNHSSDLYKGGCLDCGMLTLNDCYPLTPRSAVNSATSSPSSSSSVLQHQCSSSSRPSCSPEHIISGVISGGGSSSSNSSSSGAVVSSGNTTMNNQSNQNYPSNSSFINLSASNVADESILRNDHLKEEVSTPCSQDCNQDDQKNTHSSNPSVECDTVVGQQSHCDRSNNNINNSEHQNDVMLGHSFLSSSNLQGQQLPPSCSSEVFEPNTDPLKKEIEFSSTVLEIPDIKSIEEEAAYHNYTSDLQMKQNDCDLPVLDLELENIINGSFNENDEYKRKVESTTNEIMKVVFENGELNNDCNMLVGAAAPPGSLPLPGFNQAFGSTEIGRYLQQKDFLQQAVPTFVSPAQLMEPPSLFTLQQQHHQQFQLKQLAQQQQHHAMQQQHQQHQHQQYLPYNNNVNLNSHNNNNNNNMLTSTSNTSSVMSLAPTTIGGPTSVGGTAGGKSKSTRGGKRGSKAAAAANIADISKQPTPSANVWINPYEQPDLPPSSSSSSSGMSTPPNGAYYSSNNNNSSNNGSGGGASRRKESRRGKSYAGGSSSSVVMDSPQVPYPTTGGGWNCYRGGGLPTQDCCSGMYSAAHGGCQFSSAPPTTADMVASAGNGVCDYYGGRESHLQHHGVAAGGCLVPPPYGSSNHKSPYYNSPPGGGSTTTMMMEQQSSFGQSPRSACYGGGGGQNWRNDRYYPYGDYSSYPCGARQQPYVGGSINSSNSSTSNSSSSSSSNSNSSNNNNNNSSLYQSCVHPHMQQSHSHPAQQLLAATSLQQQSLPSPVYNGGNNYNNYNNPYGMMNSYNTNNNTNGVNNGTDDGGNYY